MTDGSVAAPGQVGEFVQTVINGTFNAAAQTQALSTLILQPGDWDAVAWCIMSPITGQSSAIDGAWFQLSPQPPGASGNMFVANMANPTAMVPSDFSAWLTTIGPRTQINVSVPTLLAFSLNTNPSAAGAAGNFQFFVNARRMR